MIATVRHVAEDGERRIVAEPCGPYQVHGNVPIRRLRPVYSEYGEPMTWEVTERFDPKPVVFLCRCGHSRRKPFCDSSHTGLPFDGDDGAPQTTYDERARTFDVPGIVVRDDRMLCEHAGFCGTRITSIWKLLDDRATEDTTVRAQVITMIERCPSGALTFRLTADGSDLEPDLPASIGVVDDGPLFVSGNIPIERADGTPLETRNRVTLCRCGESAIRPLCDGTHKKTGFSDPSD